MGGSAVAPDRRYEHGGSLLIDHRPGDKYGSVIEIDHGGDEVTAVRWKSLGEMIGLMADSLESGSALPYSRQYTRVPRLDEGPPRHGRREGRVRARAHVGRSQSRAALARLGTDERLPEEIRKLVVYPLGHQRAVTPLRPRPGSHSRPWTARGTPRPT